MRRDSPTRSIPRWGGGSARQELFANWRGGGDPRRLKRPQWRRLERAARKSRDPKQARRYRIIVLLAKRWSPTQVAEALGCARGTVYNVRRRWMEAGEAGLVDGREDNGWMKVTPEFLKALWQTLQKTPEDFGWSRPTWTRELLIRTLHSQKDQPQVSPATMTRALVATTPPVRCTAM